MLRDPDVLPLPPEDFQASISGVSGQAALDHGAEVHRLFTELVERHGRPLESVLDFGCGWGRITRFFIDVENLWGVDVNPEAIRACRETNPFARFEVVDTFPPSGFEDHTFDLVYAWSVFSHLSEAAHLAWLKEFKRILKPGGMLLLTTLSRLEIEKCAALRQRDPESLAEWQLQNARSFPDTAATLAAYDRGEYCYFPAREHFGITCIPETYVRGRWPFETLGYFQRLTQIVIVCRKPKLGSVSLSLEGA